MFARVIDSAAAPDGAAQHQSAEPAADPRGADPRGEVVRRLRAQLRLAAPQVEPAARVERLVPVHAALAGLLPEGGLRPGSVYSVRSGGALLLTLLAGACAAGDWCGVIGMPGFGIEAAQLAGVDLDRLVLVPEPGERWLAVAAALAEVLPVIAIRPATPVRDGEAARLAARLRDRETVLLALGPWPQAEATFSVRAAEWSGLDAGHGYLAEREVTVTVASKRVPSPRSARLLLPGANGAIAVPAPAAGAPVHAEPGLRAVG